MYSSMPRAVSLRNSRPVALAAAMCLVGGMLAWLLLRPVTAPETLAPVVVPTVDQLPNKSHATHGQFPRPSEPLKPTGPVPHPGPLPPPLQGFHVSSRYAKVDPKVFATYVDRFAEPTGDDPNPAAHPSMLNLTQLYIATASYRSALLYHGSEHVADLYEHELILLAMGQGGVIGFDRLKDQACELKGAPKDCPEGRFPTCGTYERLTSLATRLCADPTEPIPIYHGGDADMGLGR